VVAQPDGELAFLDIPRNSGGGNDTSAGRYGVVFVLQSHSNIISLNQCGILKSLLVLE
jgi:hypothetical protein